jgi:hypothetical protein
MPFSFCNSAFQLERIAVSDRSTLERLTQFRFMASGVPGKRLQGRDISDRICVKGGFCATLFRLPTFRLGMIVFRKIVCSSSTNGTR